MTSRRKRLPLPRKFQASLTEEAYARLRQLNEEHGLGNNYLLTVLLERLDDYAESDRLKKVFSEFIEEFGAPAAKMNTTATCLPMGESGRKDQKGGTNA